MRLLLIFNYHLFTALLIKLPINSGILWAVMLYMFVRNPNFFLEKVGKLIKKKSYFSYFIYKYIILYLLDICFVLVSHFYNTNSQLDFKREKKINDGCIYILF